MQTLQVVVASFSAAVFVVLARIRRVRHASDSQWLALALALSLFIPLLAGSRGGPERWLVLGSARLYVAPIVLPVVLFLLGAPLRVPAIYAASVATAATALMLHPDASQLSAFALAVLVLLAAPKFASTTPFGTLGGSAVLHSCRVAHSRFACSGALCGRCLRCRG